MARAFGEGFKRVQRFDPVTSQVISTEKVIGTNGVHKIEILALDGENIFEPMDPDKAKLNIGT